MLERGLDINFQNKQGESALHNAAFTGNTHIINALIDKGANPNLLNQFVFLPLFLCGSLIVLFLFFFFSFSTGDTPLHYSVRRGDPSIVSLLVCVFLSPLFLSLTLMDFSRSPKEPIQISLEWKGMPSNSPSKILNTKSWPSCFQRVCSSFLFLFFLSEN